MSPATVLSLHKVHRVQPLPAPYRLLPLVPPGVFYDVRIFLDTWNAPIAEVGTAVLRVAAELGAFAIVVAANDQVGTLISSSVKLLAQSITSSCHLISS